MKNTHVTYPSPTTAFVDSQDGGSSDDTLALQRARNDNAIQLLRWWREGDESDTQEQCETWEYLKQALDQDRLSDRKLFP